MVEYLEQYARSNRIDVRLNTAVDRVDRDGDRWVVSSSAGDFVADHVIVAGGYDHSPFIPDWPGREGFERPLLHAAGYRNPDRFRDDDVLVVGPGCSGMEIAYDLATGGAGRVRLAVRTPPNILVRAPLGPLFARLMLRLPTERADRLMSSIRKREVGDLTAYGLPEPEEGVFSRLKRLGVPPAIVDKPMLEAVKDGLIEVVSGVESLDETGVRLADGERVAPDAVIAATGYRRGLEPMVGHLGVLDERGEPRVRHGDEAAPGLRFVGYVPRPAMLGYMGGEARRAAKAIAGQRKPSFLRLPTRARPAAAA